MTIKEAIKTVEEIVKIENGLYVIETGKLYGDVHGWDNENGQGEFVLSKEIELFSKNYEGKTIKECKTNLFNNLILHFPSLKSYTEDQFFSECISEDGYLSFNTIENEDGLEDKNGSFIVNYWFSLEFYKKEKISLF